MCAKIEKSGMDLVIGQSGSQSSLQWSIRANQRIDIGWSFLLVFLFLLHLFLEKGKGIRNE